MGWKKWGAMASIMAITISAVAYYNYNKLRPDCPGLNLDGIQVLRYEIIDTQFYDSPHTNITNRTIAGNIILKVSRSGKAYDIERISDNLAHAGPNVTFSVDNRGNVADIRFKEGRSDNSTVLFFAAKGSSFDFPELIPMPENGVIVPQSWSAVVHFNYTIHTASSASPGSMFFQQTGFSRYDLEAVGQSSITTPAGIFTAIEIKYEKTVSWTTWELGPSNSIPEDDQGDKEEAKVIGTCMIEPETGIVIQNSWVSEYKGYLAKHAFTTRLTDIEPQDGR